MVGVSFVFLVCPASFEVGRAAEVTSHRWHQPGNRRGVHEDQSPECDDREAERHIEGGPGGQELWAVTSTAITAIQVTLITPTATSIAISAALEPTQHAPNSKPGPAICWQRRRKCRFSGVSS